MTVYLKNEGVGPGAIFAIDYLDPAGAFSGTFLHVLPTTAAMGSVTYADYDFGGSKYVVLAASVNARLASMFGDNRALWTARHVQSVTPAVVDDNW